MNTHDDREAVPPGDIAGTRISRRDVLRALGLGGTVAVGAAFAASTLDVSARQEAILGAPEEIQPRLPGGPTVEDTARELAYSIEKMFRFVADEVQYDAYAGALRGAKGTLWGMAGNSVDQAILLAELLGQALVPTRFVIGELDDDGETKLLNSMRLNEAMARARADQVLRLFPQRDEAHHVQATSESLTPEEEFLQPLQESRAQLLETARSQLDAGLQTIEGALADADLPLPEFSVQLPDRERRQHVRVQYADGPLWIDLDPTMTNATPGQRLGSVADVIAELPVGLFHRIRLRLVAEIVSGGQPVRQDRLAYEARALDLTAVPLTVLHVRPEALKAAGMAVSEVIGGRLSYVPHVFVGEEVIVGEPIIFVTDDGVLDVFGEVTREGDTLAEWLEIEVISPDAPARQADREIFDRIGLSRRTKGDVSVDDIAPIELVDLPELGEVYPPLATVIDVAAVGGMTPATYFEQDLSVDDFVSDSALPNFGYHYVRDSIQADIAAEIGYRTYLDRPNISLFVQTPIGVDEDEPVSQSFLDILHQGYGFASIGSVETQGNPRMMMGILAHVAERNLLEGAVEAVPQDLPASFEGVGHVFEAARRNDVPIRTLAPGVSMHVIEASDEALIRIEAAIAEGYVVIVPDRPSELSGRSVTGWWEFDPLIGVVFDRMENGRSQDLGEYGVLLQTMWRQYKAYQCLVGIRTMALIVVGILSGKISNDPSVTVGNATAIRHCV
jgi:hypothetical protein